MTEPERTYRRLVLAAILLTVALGFFYRQFRDPGPPPKLRTYAPDAYYLKIDSDGGTVIIECEERREVPVNSTATCRALMQGFGSTVSVPLGVIGEKYRAFREK